MSTQATPEGINALIDAAVAALKAQITALTFTAPAPVVTVPTINYPTPPSFTVSIAIASLTPTVGGSPATYSATLPSGLSINATTGVISGTPTTAKAASNYAVVATNSAGADTANLVFTVLAPAVVTPPSTNPGGAASKPVTYSNISNQTISNLSFDGAKASVDLLTLNSCSNVHITMCRFSNTNGNAISLNNCSNITIDYNFFTLVGFGVLGKSCVSTKVNNNQGLNRWAPVEYNSNFAHWVQFNTCSGAGQQINNNIFEDVTGVAVHPHDHISVYASNGTAASPIQMIGNWIRGGQQVGWPTANDTGGGIMPGDVSGSYQICQNNTLVNPGCAGIQCIGSATNITIDSNRIYQVAGSTIAMNGVDISSTNLLILTNNRVNYTNKWGHNQLLADGEPGYWLGGKSSLPNITMTGNVWYDPTITTAILPTTIITYK